MCSMKKEFSFILFMLLIPFYSQANGFWLGAGTLTHNFLHSQTDKTGKTNKFDFFPIVLAGATWSSPLQGISFSPGIGYAKMLKSKDNTKKSEIVLQYHLSQRIFNGVQFRYGFSTYITKVSGDGGTVQLNNGNSTSTFYVPEKTSTSYTGSLDLGAEAFMLQNISMRLQFSILRFLSSDKRKVTHLLSANYYF